MAGPKRAAILGGKKRSTNNNQNMLANRKISWQNWEAAGFAGKNKRPRKIDEASFLVSIFASIFGTTTAWLLISDYCNVLPDTN